MPAFITVKSAREDDQVALWERHPDHPGGEVFVTGEREVKVAKTSGVMRQLSRHQLVEVTKPAASSTSKK